MLFAVQVCVMLLGLSLGEEVKLTIMPFKLAQVEINSSLRTDFSKLSELNRYYNTGYSYSGSSSYQQPSYSSGSSYQQPSYSSGGSYYSRPSSGSSSYSRPSSGTSYNNYPSSSGNSYYSYPSSGTSHYSSYPSTYSTGGTGGYTVGSLVQPSVFGCATGSSSYYYGRK